MGDRESFPDDSSLLGAGRIPGPHGVDVFDEPPALPADARRRTPVRLTGRTHPDFRSSFSLENEVIGAGTGCEGCSEANCVRITGTLESTYSVTTTVTLPRVSDFPGLTRCQRERVREAIETILAPHEQEHVAAFHTYDGSTSTPVDITMCRGRGFRREALARVRAIHDAEKSSRQAAAQALSDALDPFHVDADVNCED